MRVEWRRGCGVGCAVLLLLVVALAGGGIWFAGRMDAAFDEVRVSEEALAAAHGYPGDWAPVSLVPDTSRVARFVRVRAQLDDWRGRLAAHTERLAALEAAGGDPVSRFVRRLRAGGELATLYAGFWTARNEALLAHGMGGGEYVWLYHLAYTAWLGHPPDAGGDKSNWYRGRDPLPGRGRDRLADGRAAARERGRATLRRLRRHRVMRQLERAAPTASEQRVWRREELARLADDPARAPWATDLPAPMAAAFAPYRPALVATWNPVTNPVELIFEYEAAPAE